MNGDGKNAIKNDNKNKATRAGNYFSWFYF